MGSVSGTGIAAGMRLLRRSELTLFRDHLLRLDAAGRRDRFNGPGADAFLEAYAERCFATGALVAGYVENGMVRAAAELHEMEAALTPSGEAAFSVEKEWRGRGIGGRLFERLMAAAVDFGYARLFLTTHSGNEAMKRLARRYGAELSFEGNQASGCILLPAREAEAA